MRMCVTCHQEMCATCGEGSLHNSIKEGTKIASDYDIQPLSLIGSNMESYDINLLHGK